MSSEEERAAEEQRAKDAAAKPDDKKEKGFFDKLTDSLGDNKVTAIGLGVALFAAAGGAGFGAILFAIAALILGANYDEKGIVKKTWDSFSDKKPDTPAAPAAETAAAPSTAKEVKDAAAPAEQNVTAPKAAEYTHVFIDKNGNVLPEKQPNSIQVAIDKGGRISHYNEIGNDNRVTKNINDKPIEYIGKPIDLPMKDGVVDLKDPKTLSEFKRIGELFNRGSVTQQAVSPQAAPTLATVDSAPAVTLKKLLTPDGSELKKLEPYYGKSDAPKTEEAQIWKIALDAVRQKAASIVDVSNNTRFTIGADNRPTNTAQSEMMQIRINPENGKILQLIFANKEGSFVADDATKINVAAENIENLKITKQNGKSVIDTSSPENQNVLKELRNKFGSKQGSSMNLPFIEYTQSALGGVPVQSFKTAALPTHDKLL